MNNERLVPYGMWHLINKTIFLLIFTIFISLYVEAAPLYNSLPDLKSGYIRYNERKVITLNKTIIDENGATVSKTIEYQIPELMECEITKKLGKERFISYRIIVPPNHRNLTDPRIPHDIQDCYDNDFNYKEIITCYKSKGVPIIQERHTKYDRTQTPYLYRIILPIKNKGFYFLYIVGPHVPQGVYWSTLEEINADVYNLAAYERSNKITALAENSVVFYHSYKKVSPPDPRFLSLANSQYMRYLDLSELVDFLDINPLVEQSEIGVDVFKAYSWLVSSLSDYSVIHHQSDYVNPGTQDNNARSHCRPDKNYRENISFVMRTAAYLLDYPGNMPVDCSLKRVYPEGYNGNRLLVPGEAIYTQLDCSQKDGEEESYYAYINTDWGEDYTKESMHFVNDGGNHCVPIVSTSWPSIQKLGFNAFTSGIASSIHGNLTATLRVGVYDSNDMPNKRVEGMPLKKSAYEVCAVIVDENSYYNAQNITSQSVTTAGFGNQDVRTVWFPLSANRICIPINVTWDLSEDLSEDL